MVTGTKAGREARQAEAQIAAERSLVELALERMNQGFAPPPELYLVQNRHRIPWSDFPAWARPNDPEIFDGCCHEG